ncbi:MAG: peptidoglycan-binding protein [Mesorhizobium sp.]
MADAPPARQPLRRNERPSYERSAREDSRDDMYEPRRWSAGREQAGEIARSIEESRRQEENAADISRIARELQAMRDELRTQMGAGLKHEFKSIRTDIERLYNAAMTGLQGEELTGELERLSSAIGSLASRADDRSVHLLRDELDEVKSAIRHLAREDTILNVARNWEDFDRRFDEFERRMDMSSRGPSGSDPAIAALQERLEDIADAVNNIPESMSLRNLEDKVRTLAGAIDRFAGSQADTGSFSLIEDRLNEISRAIVASSLGGGTNAGPSVDQFERIEARISSLARQIEELASDRPTGELIDRINLLSQRVDEVNRRSQLPNDDIDRLGVQLDDIARKMGAGFTAPDSEQVVRGLESRIESLAETLHRQQGDADRRGMSIFRELEGKITELSDRLNTPTGVDGHSLMGAIDARFEELTRRFDQAAAGGSTDAIRGLEDRLEDISARLELSSRSAGVDPQILRSLETQVAGLTDHLSRPGSSLPDFEDISPRLAQIEQSIVTNREAILESAREVAEQTIRQMAGNAGGASEPSAVAALNEDLRALDSLTRKADERNARTFEAIHDTLLKIVDRLGMLEQQPAARKPTLQETPPLDVAMSIPEPEFVPVAETAAQPRRSPAQAAADAAFAAQKDDLSAQRDNTNSGRKSLLGGLAKAFKGRREEVRDAQLAGDAPVSSIDIDDALDPSVANLPLEPGSGAPDLNAIMKRVRDERAQSARSNDTDAVRSDFIAAARRNAQAAAADAETRRRAADSQDSKSSKGFGSILKKHRKTLLMAAGFVVLALGAMQVGRSFLSDGGETAAISVPGEDASARAIAPLSATPEPAGQLSDALLAPSVSEGEEDLETVDGSHDESIETAALPEEIQEQAIGPLGPITPAAEPSQAGSPPVSAPVAEVLDVPASVGPVVLREAASSGDPKAMFEIASRYAEGRGVAQDLAAAAKWYEHAADSGLAPAQYRIGNFYEKGTGVERDIAKAKTWYQMAADQGNASAMHNLAVLYAMGADGTADNESAGRWFVKAADLGVRDSQFNLGILAAKGIGMPENLEESYKWFALVAKAGDKDAASKRDEIAKALRPEQLERARGAAELWRPKEVIPEANEVNVPDGWIDGGGSTASIDMKQAIRTAQLILNKNGYDAGGADGVMGAKTRSALASFQKDNGLKQTGDINEEVVNALLKKK